MGNDFTDITGSLLSVTIRFPDPNQNSVEVPIPVSMLPPQAQQLLATPLSAQFQTFWSVTKDNNGQTQRDRAVATAQQNISTQVHANTGQTAYNIAVNFPASGSLFAAASGDLTLEYRLPGEVITFNVTTPTIFGSYADPAYKLTFDATLVVDSPIPAMPCTFAPVASLVIENANISGDNFVANVIDFVANAANFFQGQPPIFQAAEGNIDGANPASIGTLGGTFAQLAAACVTAQAAGFVQFQVFVDQANAILVFRLIHPLDDPPMFQDQTFPSLFHPLIGVSQTQIKAGDPLGVTGSEFTAPSTVTLVLVWNDTTSGTIVRSEIEYGPQGGPFVTVSKARQPFDSGNNYQFNNLAPNQNYQFRVRDWDQTTSTPWSMWKNVATAGSNADQVLLWLDNDFGNPLGTATVAADGTFSTTVTIPSATAPGQHLLNGQLMGGDAAYPVTIQVLGATQSYTATIELIDPSTNRVVTSTEETYPFTLRGLGFNAGQLNIAIDSISGTSIGQATVGSDGKFMATYTMPSGILGSHLFVAWQFVGSSTVQASTPFFCQKLPQ
jgi:hypothetical protein